jgi:hypothetical protein
MKLLPHVKWVQYYQRYKAAYMVLPISVAKQSKQRTSCAACTLGSRSEFRQGRAYSSAAFCEAISDILLRSTFYFLYTV